MKEVTVARTKRVSVTLERVARVRLVMQVPPLGVRHEMETLPGVDAAA